MTLPARPLHDLIPTLYRLRDTGFPLEALLRIVGEQVDLLEADIESLYDNWFIETCAGWVVPYIGDLVGWRAAAGTGLDPRREVANTVRARRRRGTATALEKLATDLTGWPARVTEHFRVLAVAQDVNDVRLDRGRLADLRDHAALARLGGPFDALTRIADLREAASPRGPGRPSVSGVGLSVWRLRTYPVTRAQANCQEGIDPRAFTFSALGNDVPLFNQPRPETGETAGELSLPIPLDAGARIEDHHGANRSFEIELRPRGRVPQDRVAIADLSSWTWTAPPDKDLAVDPVRGRILFSGRRPPPPRTGVRVRYRYGFPADLGGGEYDRPIAELPGARSWTVRGESELRHALARWREERPPRAVIELADSQVYTLTNRRDFELRLAERQVLHLRAANRTRPVLRLLDIGPDRPDGLRLRGGRGSRLVIDGLLLTGRPLRVEGPVEQLVIRHSTLVPGWDLDPDCRPSAPAEPSLELVDGPVRVTIEHSIIGSVQLARNPADVTANPGDVPVRLCIADSVLDATGTGREALGAPGTGSAHAVLTIVRSSVLGRIEVRAIELAENSILDGRVRVAHAQRGCVRFCYVRPGSRTPRRHHCQPDLAAAGLIGAAREAAEQRVRPAYDSTAYGTPDYLRLDAGCPAEIFRGADDESEMGVYHDLFQPQRLSALRVRADEYTPAAMRTGIVLAT